MGFYYSDDPVRDFERMDRDQSAYLRSLPVCEYCGEPIADDELYEIDGAEIHCDCLFDYCNENFKKNND